MLLLSVVAALLAQAPKSDARLVGTWLLEGEPFATLKADGTMEAIDERGTWKADGKTLTLVDTDGEVDRGSYTLEGDALTVSFGGHTLRLSRAGKTKPGKPEPPAAGKPGKPEAGAPANPLLTKLLLSSAWCFFRYSAAGGTTQTERIVFAANGTWSSNAQRDVYSSGRNGQYFAENNSGSGGRWQVKGDALWMGEGDGPLQPLPRFDVTRNSNGWPIIHADGREYSSCN